MTRYDTYIEYKNLDIDSMLPVLGVKWLSHKDHIIRRIEIDCTDFNELENLPAESRRNVFHGALNDLKIIAETYEEREMGCTTIQIGNRYIRIDL